MGSGGEFVDDDTPVAGNEHLDGEEADDVELVEDSAGDGFGGGREGWGDGGRGEGDVEDMVVVGVFEDGS